MRDYGWYVYVIQAGKNGPIKIGAATDPRRRLEQLQTGSADRLHLVKVFDGGTELERELHRRLSKYRLHGEWFESSREVAKLLCAAVDEWAAGEDDRIQARLAMLSDLQ